MNEDQVFGRIMDIAWRKRITATELCEKLGLKKSAFSEWKAGRSRAYLKRAARSVLNSTAKITICTKPTNGLKKTCL